MVTTHKELKTGSCSKNRATRNKNDHFTKPIPRPLRNYLRLLRLEMFSYEFSRTFSTVGNQKSNKLFENTEACRCYKVYFHHSL